MVSRKSVTLADDLDGSEPAQPVRFAFGGTDWEIDLGEVNRKALEDVVASYAAHARPVSARKGSIPHSRTAGGRRRTAERRAWLTAHGWELGERGRIPAAGHAEYEAAHGAA